MPASQLEGIRMPPFILDNNKRIIHNTERATPECRLDKIPTFQRRDLWNKDQVNFEVNTNGYNGCPHCMPEFDYSLQEGRRRR